MKTTRFLSYMASAVAAVALLTGCSTENDIENGRGGFASLELSSVSSTDMLTRAAIDGVEFPTDKGNIGLFLYADGEASQPYGDGYENVQYTYNSTKSKWTASPSVKVGSTPGYLYGYYPYNAANTDVKAITVSSSVNGDDVMYASQQKYPITDQTAANTNLTMNHALARVAITVINNGYTGEAKLSSIKFEGATIANSGTLNATDGIIKASKADEVALSVPAAEQTIATRDGSTYECLLVPSSINSNRQTVTLSLTIDGEVKSVTLSGGNGVIFNQGVKSTIKITLSNTGIALKSVSINDWQTVKVGEHTVTVKCANDITPHDVLTEVYADGGALKIEALSKLGKYLTCTIDGEAEVSRSNSGNLFTFTVSGISENTTATIGYEKPLTVTPSSNNSRWGSATYTGEPYKGKMITLTATANDGFKFIGWQDAKGNTLSKNNPYSVTLTSDLTVTAIFAPDKALNSIFTVAADELGNPTKKVFFSQGNLYYDYFRYNIEDKQYCFRTYQGYGSCINSTSISNDGTPSANWGLFGWVGNSSTTFTTAPEKYGVTTSTTESDYGNVANESLKSDWGTTLNGLWRTLTIEEWEYLLVGRPNAADKKGLAMVSEVPGLIILPDAFTDPMKNSGSNAFVPFVNITGSYTDNLFTTVNWGAMEAAGAVFLPAAGFRSGEKVDGISKVGYYWSSSSGKFIDADAETNALYIFFRNGEIEEKQSGLRSRGYSVRLVIDVK